MNRSYRLQFSRPGPVTALLAVLIQPAASATLAPNEPVAIPATATKVVQLGDLLDKSAAEREQRLTRLLQDALNRPGKTGTWQRLQGRTLVPLTAQKAALGALTRNLGIEVDRHEAERARRAILEAKAVFDPVLTVNVGYNRKETFDRTLTGTVQQQSFAPGTQKKTEGVNLQPGESFLDLRKSINKVPGLENSHLVGIIFGTTTRQTLPDQRIFVSRADPNGPSEGMNYGAGLTQQLPWGPRYDLSVVSTDRTTYYDRQGHSFEAPWSSALRLNLRVPLNSLGEYAIRDTELKLAEKVSEQLHWTLNATINSTLLDTSLAYLELLRGLERLQAAIENRQLVERQVTHTGRLINAGQATTYEAAQIEAARASAQAQEEAAKANYILASDTLTTLLEVNRNAVHDQVYQPSEYSAWLDSTLDFDAKAVEALALRKRPELQERRVNEAASEIARRGAEVRVRPDINLDIGVTAQQDGSTIGYRSLADSLGNVGEPDVLSQNYGLSYRYPWGNKFLKARLARTEIGVRDAALSTRATGNAVIRDINDALSAVRTARARIATTTQRLNAARAAYESLARVQEAGGSVNENELIITFGNLLQAKQENIDARIDNKQAEASLLAAQGTIAEHYAGVIAPSPFERYRLRRLAQRDDLEYFLK
jgi:outer membrane protein TolC